MFLNAAQALEARGTVRVRLTERRDAVTIAVHDEGPGIAPAIRDAIFQPFFTTKRSGTGLGLAIVRRLVELHGGSVAVDADGGPGTVMTVTLPGGAAAHLTDEQSVTRAKSA